MCRKDSICEGEGAPVVRDGGIVPVRVDVFQSSPNWYVYACKDMLTVAWLAHSEALIQTKALPSLLE